LSVVFDKKEDNLVQQYDFSSRSLKQAKATTFIFPVFLCVIHLAVKFGKIFPLRM